MRSVYLRPSVIFLLLGFCSLIYYLGELVDWAAWDVLRANFFYGIHDVHRLLFLAPIIYAGYTARIRAAIIVTLISFIIFLPRAFTISPYPDPLLRMVIFVVFAGVIGVLVGVIRNQSEKAQQLKTLVSREKDRLLKILDGMADGVMITDQHYTIRYMNSKMVAIFGDGTGATCYQHFHKLGAPCQQECRLLDVITRGDTEGWRCCFPDDKAYEVKAAPYIDSDGTVCQISVFRDIMKHVASPQRK